MEPPADVKLVGALIAGRYRVRSKLGQGGMGTVYLAEHEQLGREVAVKVLGTKQDGEAKERFMREARAASRLNHPNIATIYEFGETEHGPFIAMEFAQGVTLRKLMRREKQVTWRRASLIASQICRALAAAHQEGIVHRDVKPENIVVDELDDGDELKLLDFGLANIVEEEASPLTQTGMVMGTAAYISPEQLDGTSNDVRSDLYALGIILFEMIAGHHPFVGKTPTQLVVAHVTKEPPTLEETVGGEVPESISDFVARLLAKEPSARPSDGAGALQALAAAVQQGDTGQHTGSHSLLRVADDDAPSGRVSMVFTDIEGSTSMWERRPRAMQQALDIHNALLREGLHRHDGYEVKTQGDAFFVAFASELDAMRWAIETQRALAAQVWPDGIADGAADRSATGEQARVPALRVRMGLHVGSPNCRRDPVTGRMDYFGPDVNLCARVEAAAHGGQILMSHAFSKSVELDAAEEGASRRALGRFRLDGVRDAEELAELVDGKAKERHFPAPRAQSRAVRTNIQNEHSSFVGRSREFERIRNRLVEGGRLLTLLGPGGTGKSRLARVVAASLLDDGCCFDEAWFCDLSSAVDELGVIAKVGSVLGVPLSGGQSLEDARHTLGRSLESRGRVLLIVDNLEQVIATAPALLAHLLDSVESLQLVATSREVLSIDGEERIELEPLPVDEGVELFLARAKEHGLEVPEVDEDLRQLVQALDGMPLAIELAASRVGLMTPSQMLARLHQRFELLRGSRRDVSERQATLRGAIDWSWELLSEAEKLAFAQLATFEDGAGISGIEAVIDLSSAADAPFVLDVVQALRDKSLLRSRMDTTGEMRLSMLQSIHDYARQKLSENESLSEQARRRHAQFYLQEGRRYAKASVGADAKMAIEWLQNNRQNLLALVQRYSLSEPEWACRAAMALEPLMLERAPRQLHRELLDEAIDCARDAEDTNLLVEVLLLRSKLEHEGGDAEYALELADECLELLEEHDAPALLCNAMVRRGRILFRMGQLDDASATMDAAEPLAKKLGLSALLARILSQKALGAHSTMAPPERLLDRALRLARRSGNRNLEARIFGIRGVDKMVRGSFEEAEREHRAAVELHDHNGSKGLVGLSKGNLGIVLLLLGRKEESERVLREAIEIHNQLGNTLLEGADMANLAATLIEMGRYSEAFELAQEAERLTASTKGLRELMVCRCFLAVASACLGRVDEAERHLADAKECAAPFWKAMSHVMAFVEAQVDLARARRDGGADDDERFVAAVETARRLSEVNSRLYICPDSLDRMSEHYPTLAPDLASAPELASR